jgi:hypothetical protein
MRRGQIIGIVALIILLAALTGWWGIPTNNNPVQYHLGKMHSLRDSIGFAPRTWKDYFRPVTWRWYFHGKKPIDRTLKELEEHRDALIQLGYFERREFVLKRRRLDSAAGKELHAMLSKASLACRDWVYSTTGVAPVDALTVTTTPADLKIWSNVIANFDAKGVK